MESTSGKLRWLQADKEHEAVLQWYQRAYSQLVATPEKTIAEQDLELRAEAWRKIDEIQTKYFYVQSAEQEES